MAGHNYVQGCLDSVVVSHSDIKLRDMGLISSQDIASFYLKKLFHYYKSPFYAFTVLAARQALQI